MNILNIRPYNSIQIEFITVGMQKWKYSMILLSYLDLYLLFHVGIGQEPLKIAKHLFKELIWANSRRRLGCEFPKGNFFLPLCFPSLILLVPKLNSSFFATALIPWYVPDHLRNIKANNSKQRRTQLVLCEWPSVCFGNLKFCRLLTVNRVRL